MLNKCNLLMINLPNFHNFFFQILSKNEDKYIKESDLLSNVRVQTYVFCDPTTTLESPSQLGNSNSLH